MSSSSSIISNRMRLKREECKRTHHDSVFSKWEILIGSSDWKDYSRGKDGVQRYRTHNLPNGSSCPGLYELGVALIPGLDEGRKSRNHESRNILVVYLGQTNNVRTRLQQYGRFGAHLDSGKLLTSSRDENDCCSGLFKQIFSRGYSIMFRWAPMIDKKTAEKTEAELLDIFDYAWNKCGNGSCRRDEILSKLDSKGTSQISTALRKLQLWKHPAFGRKSGINIDASVPLDEEKGFLLPQVFKFGKSQLHFVYGNNRLYEDHKICGVAVGNGSVCKNMPPLGRQRCEEHKGKKIIGTGSSKESRTACGLVLEDGSLCAQLPSYGRKRCEAHNGKRTYKLDPDDVPHVGSWDLFDQKETTSLKCHRQLPEGLKHGEENSICGVVYGDGTMCIRKPVSGRKRCEVHKGRKIRVLLPKMSLEGLDKKENPSICGVSLEDGSTCMKPPVPGRKRCQSHKVRRYEMIQLKLMNLDAKYDFHNRSSDSLLLPNAEVLTVHKKWGK